MIFMKITKAMFKKLAGNLAIVLLLVLNGQGFLDLSGDVVQVLNEAR